MAEAMLTGASEMTPAINRYRLPRHPARAIRGQEQNQRRDLLWLSRAAERVRLLRALEKRRVLRLAHAGAAVQVRDRHTGIDRVDAHAERRHLDRRATG